MNKTEKAVFDLAEPIAAEIGLRIYETEYKKEGPDWYLRVFLYSENGVDLDNCEYVSRRLSDKLDEEDFIQNAYMLEVSSPGINRVLTRDWHYETAIGQEVELKLYEQISGSKTLYGILTEYNSDTLTVYVEGELINIENKKIASAKLCILK